MANNFKNYANSAVGTALTTVYTAGSGVQATVIGMSISNVLSSSVTANVIVNISGSNYFMVKSAQIDPGSALIPIGGDQKLVLEAGDYVAVQSNTSSSVDVIMSLLEIS